MGHNQPVFKTWQDSACRLAVWCPPCREENPNLVKLYDMYHYRGFDIYQVSLDQRKED
jgi:thiol-disulfide isomerase/thioredoxin